MIKTAELLDILLPGKLCMQEFQITLKISICLGTKFQKRFIQSRIRLSYLLL